LNRAGTEVPGARVPTRIAAFWGLGAFATTTMLNGVSIVLLFFLVNFVKIEPVIAGGLLFASKLFDACIDPPIGVLSDRTVSRFGRRRPWLLGASFFCGLSFAMLFNVPAAAGTSGTYVFLSGWLFVYTVAYAVFAVPYLAMPGEMTDDYHERSRLMSWRTVFMTFGNLMGSAVPPVIVAAFGGDRLAYGQMGIVLGAVIFTAMFLTFAGTAGAAQRDPDPRPLSLAGNFRLLRGNLPLLVLMGTKILLYVGLAAFSAVLLFFFSSLLKKSPAEVGAFFGVFSVATILFTPVQLWVGRRVEKRRAYVVCMGAYGLGMLSWLLASPAEPDAVLYVRALWLGAFNAGLFLFGYSMLVDTYAWDHQVTGLRREGFLASAISFVEKLSLAIGPLIIGALLSAMGFDKNLAPSADQSPAARQAMLLGFVWIPVGTQLAAMLLLRWYRLEQRDLVPAAAVVRTARV
jgi:GPH family glycoside/pentoside/hexuronide:cation symporter